MRRGAKRVICWDLDETLGSFREPGKGRFIPGIKPLIGRLKASGIENVVTTAASLEHATYVLHAGQMAGLFVSVFHGEKICDDDCNKHYLPVARALGISKRDARHRMLIIGNRLEDAGADLNLSFILHRMSEQCTAAVYNIMLRSIIALSDSWSDAHARLRLLARRRYRVKGEFDGGLYSISGLRLAVGRSLSDRGAMAPVDRLIEVHTVPSFLMIRKKKNVAGSVSLHVSAECRNREPARGPRDIIREAVDYCQASPEIGRR